MPWIRPGSRALAFLVVTGDPRLATRLRISLPSPRRARIRSLQASAVADVLHQAAPKREQRKREKNDGLLMTKMMDQLRVGFFGTPKYCASYELWYYLNLGAKIQTNVFYLLLLLSFNII
ncbi:hypothetical protein TRIUR3_34264 [Triticum urartu]|uniref:Uncharacterized protein n=1 Tax=Triticum urartu TaxID=4572 RepID=M8AL37_TRIUA|nr:hypothetical protein TRIUR3_34264 [Triticum urartu]